MVINIDKIKVLLFDIDEVLIDNYDEHGEYFWNKNIENDLGFKTSDIIAFWTSPTWEAIIEDRLDFPAELEKFLLSRKYAPGSSQIVIDYYLRVNTLPMRKMFETVSSITRRYPCYLATEQEKLRMEMLWTRFFRDLGFKDYFASAYLQVRKSSPLFIRKIAETLQVEPGSLLLIDDRIKNIEVAIGAGAQGYHFSTPEKAEKELFPLLD